MALWITGLLLAATAESPARYEWRFEEGAAHGLHLSGASLTTDAARVIDGGASLWVDSRGGGEVWNEFVQSDPAVVRLKPDTNYAITLRYRILEPMGEARFYLLLRSASLPGDAGDRWGGWWKTADRNSHPKRFILRTGPADDYFLILGIRGEGAMGIDDLRIGEGAPVPGGIVKARPFTSGEAWSEWQQSGLDNGVRPWLEVSQNVLDPGGWRKWDGEFADYLPRLLPDIVAYLDIPEVHRLGLPRTTMKTEYQELYLVDAERDGIPFDDFLESFEGSGLSKGLDGERILDDTWAAGGHFTCQRGERWHRFYLDKLEASFAEWDGLNQDNIGVVGAYKGHAAFCEACQEHFRDTLSAAYTEAELAAFGIADLRTFNMIDFLLEHALGGRDALRSPVVREYIKAYVLGQHEAWRDTASRVREWTRGGSKPYPVYGNNIGGMGPIPYAVTLAPWVDAVSMEHWWPAAKFYEPPRFHGAAWGYKVAAAASGYRKPVYILNALEHDTVPALKTTTELTFAEGLANGGYRVYSPGLNVPRHTGDNPLDQPEIRALHERYAAFIRAHRGLFWGRRSEHRAAVVYSVPTHLFHTFPAIPGLEDTSEYRRFAAACLMLEEAHIPYDVLVLPHPELMPELDWRERLTRCDLVVLPGVAAISREQAEALHALADAGGRIVAFRPFADHDENYNPVEGLAPVSVDGRVRILDDWDQALGDALWERRDHPEARKAMTEALDAVYPPASRQLQGSLPDGVTANVWVDDGEDYISLHLVNYQWDPASDTPAEVSGLEVSLPLHPLMSRFAPVLSTPDGPAAGPVAQSLTDGRCIIAPPPFRIYAIVTWGDAAALQAKTRYADAFQAGMRLAKRSRPGEPGEPLPARWWDELVAARRKGDDETIRALQARWSRELAERLGR